MLDVARARLRAARRFVVPICLFSVALALPAAARAEAPRGFTGGAAPPPAGDVVTQPLTGAVGAIVAGAVQTVGDAAAGAAQQAIATASGSCRGASADASRAERAMLRGAAMCLVNRARRASGLRALTANARLARAAAGHARDMARRGYFGHQRPGGRSLAQRTRAAGWHGRTLGEAIAYGCGSLARAAEIVAAWLRSPPHRAILLARNLGHVGLGVARPAPVRCAGGATWVLDAGS